jgi:predicted dehydrogenase
MRAVIVGAGGMGRAWAENLKTHPEAEIAGWVDIRREVAEEAAERLQLANIHVGDDLERALTECKPDFVVDVTVPEAHRDVTVLALSKGIPVLGEKPMAHSLDAAREMVEASERSGKLYMVSQSRRYDPRLHAYRRAIEREVGAIGILTADFFIGAHFGGFRDEMESPLILDMAIHTFDQARFLSRRDAVTVYCEEYNPAWSWYRGDACANAFFEMEGGLRFAYRGSWCAEGLHTSWDCAWRAVGPQGTALWDGHGEPRYAAVEKTGGFHSEYREGNEPVEEGVPTGIRGSLNEFLHALRTGETPMGECHDNIRSLAMVFSALESSRTGRRVSVPRE